jgi:hypothetical protein
MPPLRPPFRLVSLLAISGVLAAAACFGLLPNRTHAAPLSFSAPPLVVIKAVQKFGPLPSTGSTGPALPVGKGAAGSTSTASPTSEQTWLEITVSNVGDGGITGLTINYHVFSKTSTEGKTATVTMKDDSGTQNVDLPYEKSVVVKTTPIIKQISSGLPTTGNRGNGGGAQAAPKKAGTKSSATTSSTVTDIAGWYIEAVTTDPNKPIKAIENPTGIVQMFENLQSQNGN